MVISGIFTDVNYPEDKKIIEHIMKEYDNIQELKKKINYNK